MKLRSILLFLMITWQLLLQLNLLESINIPYVNFIPLFMSPLWFWIIYLGIEVFLMITLLGSGTVVKTKNITNTHIHPDKGEIEKLKTEIERKNKRIEELENDKED